MNFDQTLDRRGTNSMKWDVAEGQLPMGLADMDFETVPGGQGSNSAPGAARSVRLYAGV